MHPLESRFRVFAGPLIGNTPDHFRFLLTGWQLFQTGQGSLSIFLDPNVDDALVSLRLIVGIYQIFNPVQCALQIVLCIGSGKLPDGFPFLL